MTSTPHAEFVVGIDLGTSNSALAYASLEEVRRLGRPAIHVLAVPQLVAPGDVQNRALLASAIYEPAEYEFAAGQTDLPWSKATEEAKARTFNVVGEAARRLGARTPVRLIESAKSWLCHGGVNRTAAILPWHAPEGIPKMSPVDASAALLRHLRDAWDQEMAAENAARRLEHQRVVVTVPASFDEIARQLTLEAAKRAGLLGVTLIEEPLAAFYAFIARTGGTPRTTGLRPGDRVLVADVGGGTTDFTLVEVRRPSSESVGHDVARDVAREVARDMAQDAAREGGSSHEGWTPDEARDGAVSRDEAVLAFERTAVGDHLLLGGDNMDLAIAHALEGELSKAKKLDAEGWAQLKLECRLAKEALFANPSVESLPIVLTGRGRKLVGGTVKTELSRAQLLNIVLDGYFAALEPGDEARPLRAPRAAGFSEYGLPFASEPAITRHLAAFLCRHAPPGEAVTPIDGILFNGGTLKPTVIREHMSKVVGAFLRAKSGRADLPDPRPLTFDDGDEALELAVARGAAYFGLVREGLGVRVGGGSPREYFLGVATDASETVPDGHVRVLCIAPRGMQDGQRIDLSEQEFTLITNRPVQFPLYATTSPRQDPVGRLLTLNEAELTKLPPLQTVVRFGKQRAGTPVPVRMQVRRTELGTLEVACLSKMSGARFKLEFDLRSQETRDLQREDGDAPDAAVEARASEGRSEPDVVVAADTANTADADSMDRVGGAEPDPFGGAGLRLPPEQGEVEPERIEAAKARIEATFAMTGPRPDPDHLMKGLEDDLALKRDAWSLSILRGFAETLLEMLDRRSISADIEVRWMNLVGFCLRPGFGMPLDDWRVRQLWKIHGPGLLHPASDPAELNWWILWRRVAGGLSRGHQEELASRVFPLIIPGLAKRAKKKPPRAQSQQAAEMWRAAASLEQIGAKSRAQLGDALLTLLEERRAPRAAFWCLGRIGARRVLYGPREATVRASTVVDWVRRLMALAKPPKDESPAVCLLALARRTGDRQFDLDEPIRHEIAAFLKARDVPESLLRPLFEIVEIDRTTEGQAFGEGLPVGLRLSASGGGMV
ncbi:MAG: Hsp70 family protein [Deltaproteobacteria bacterium]|nr:Hsp70 family protein [Deltaproteobacteria bacterium]